MKFRKEFDSLGSIKVPSDKYWGASTQRSNKFFDIGDFLVRPIVIKSIAIIKKSAAIVNAKNKSIEKKISKFIYYPSFLFAPCILFFPAKVYSQIYFVITFQLIIFLGSLYCYLKVINLALKGKEFSKIFFVAGSIILYGVFHDILINFQNPKVTLKRCVNIEL